MPTTISGQTDVSAIVQRVVADAYQYGESPLALGLSLQHNERHWWVEMEMNYPYYWPRGKGTLRWDTDRYQDADEAFQDSRARFYHQGTPTWEYIETEWKALLNDTEVEDPELNPELDTIHTRLDALWDHIVHRREADVDYLYRMLRPRRED